MMFGKDPYGTPGYTVHTSVLQGNSSNWHADMTFESTPNLTWYKISNKGTDYAYTTFKKGVRTEFTKNRPGTSIRFIKGEPTFDRNAPMLRMTFTTTTYGLTQDKKINGKDKNVHKEHVFYYGSWCGDGVVDSQFGEKYDDGINNGKPGYASTDCQKKDSPPSNAICDGASNGVPTYTAPTTNLCKNGSPSAVTEVNGKFTWTCGGVNGGANVSCEAPKKMDAVCGTADGKIFSTAPTTDLCAIGTSTPLTGNNPYKWVCQGVSGGKNIECETRPNTPNNVCHQTFNQKVRVGYAYDFWDAYNNNQKFPRVLKSFSVDFRENYGDDINRDGKFTFDKFDWAPPYKAGAQIPAGAQNVKIIQTTEKYQVAVAPKKRLKDNIYVEYHVVVEGNEKEGHRECVNYEVTWCGDGVLDKDEGEQCDPNDPSKKGWGPGGCDPLTCQPKQSSNLTIKKYVNGHDAQTAADAVPVMPNEEYTYTFVVKNETNVDAKGAKVTDTLPSDIEVLSKATGTDWDCTQNGQTMTCRYNKTIKAGETAPTISLKVKLKTVITNGKVVRNVAGVCELDPSKPLNDPTCVDTRDECKPGDINYNPITKTCDPATVVVGGLDLSIKKYVDSDDAQPGSPVSKRNNDTFNYVIKVKVENGKTSGTTTVKDILPTKIETTGNATGNGWTCNYSGKTLTCTSTAEVSAGSYFPDIIVPVKLVNTGSNEIIRNDATVHNPNEKPNSCYDDNRMPNGGEQSCQKDPKNTDPAVVKTPGGGGGNPDTYIAAMCEGDVAVVKTYSSLYSCEIGIQGISDSRKKTSCQRYTSSTQLDDLREIAKKMTKDYCHTGPYIPPPTTPPGPGGGGNNGGPYCGDGIVNRVGEMCDLGSRNGQLINGKIECTADCKTFGTTTNPLENPVQFHITIPGFSKSTIGKNIGQKLISENGMVIGRGSSVFALSDTITLSMNKVYKAPIQVEADRKFVITKDASNALEGNAVKGRSIQELNGNLPWWQQTTGNRTKFVVLGEGDFLMPKDSHAQGLYDSSRIECSNYSNTQYQVCYLKSPSIDQPITLFNGSELTGFKGKNVGTGEMIFGIENYRDHNETNPISSFKVEVTNSKVSSAGSSVNRKLKSFTSRFQSTITNITRLATQGTTNTTNTDNSAGSFPFGNNTLNNVSPLNAGITNVPPSDRKITNRNIENYKHNGNSNVYSFKGDIEITCEYGKNAFEMTGVKTVLVEGNITFKCDTTYQSNDNNASWAFIVKKGNIIVDKDVKNLAGVFLTVKENNEGGKFTQSEATANILRVDGSFYGDATELFNKRTYARGTNAYDIVTSGTVFNYSNRALRNPPPLLSNYLNHYKVQRVVK